DFERCAADEGGGSHPSDLRRYTSGGLGSHSCLWHQPQSLGRIAMHRRIAIGLLASLALAAIIRPAPAAAVDKIWVGYVVHVSMNNIKVVNSEETQTLSFLILPKFKNVFSADGKTTYQMAQIKRNMLVKVYYDQNLLGQRHADKIY